MQHAKRNIDQSTRKHDIEKSCSELHDKALPYSKSIRLVKIASDLLFTVAIGALLNHVVAN